MLHDHDKDGHVEVQQSVEDELGDDEESEEERLARLERERVERENPPELQQIQILVQVEAKKRDKQRKEVLKYQRSIDEPGHTDQFQARQLRLKMECLEKCTKILKRLKKLQAKVEEMKLEGEFARACIEDIESVCQDIERLYAMNNAEEYEAAAKAAEEEQHPVPAPAVPAEEEDEALQDIE